MANCFKKYLSIVNENYEGIEEEEELFDNDTFNKIIDNFIEPEQSSMNNTDYGVSEEWRDNYNAAITTSVGIDNKVFLNDSAFIEFLLKYASKINSAQSNIEGLYILLNESIYKNNPIIKKLYSHTDFGNRIGLFYSYIYGGVRLQNWLKYYTEADEINYLIEDMQDESNSEQYIRRIRLIDLKQNIKEKKEVTIYQNYGSNCYFTSLKIPFKSFFKYTQNAKLIFFIPAEKQTPDFINRICDQYKLKKKFIGQAETPILFPTVRDNIYDLIILY